MDIEVHRRKQRVEGVKHVIEDYSAWVGKKAQLRSVWHQAHAIGIALVM